MAQVPNFKQGETFKAQVPVYDVDGITALDLSSPNATAIKVVLTIGGQEVAKYSLVSETGYDPLTVGGGSNNILEFWITREASKDFPTGPLHGAAVMELVEAAAPSGEKHIEKTFALATVTEGKAKDVEI